jgi:Fe-S-cluster containining protein
MEQHRVVRKLSTQIKIDPWLPLAHGIRVRVRNDAKKYLGCINDDDPLGDITTMIRDLYVLHSQTDHRSMPSACGPGCSICCYRHVDVIMPEAVIVLDAIKDRQDLKRRVVETAHKVGDATDTEWYLEHLGCPFVTDDGLCGIYSARPLSCRMFFSMDRKQCIRLDEQRDPDAHILFDAKPHAVGQGLQKGLSEAFTEMGYPSPAVSFVPLLAMCIENPEVLTNWYRRASG